MNITLTIQAPELATAILSLAEAIKSGSNPLTQAVSVSPEIQVVGNAPSQDNQANQTAPQQYQHPQSVPTAAPITQEPVQVQHQAPVQQVPQQAVPTSAPTYDMNQLAIAATQLVDAGRREELVQLLSSFGVPALTALPQQQYGAFATKLREMGAKI